MADRPILFSGAMIRALLAGTKTQTRRVIKPRGRVSLFDGQWSDSYVLDPGNQSWRDQDVLIKIGYRLWVREAFSYSWAVKDDPEARHLLPVWYWADGNVAGFDCGKPKPSIHMPRWASRLTLTVTDVRVQRLQDISERDALAEGIAIDPDMPAVVHRCWVDMNPSTGGEDWITGYDGRDVYRQLWHEINGAGSWEANPWVAAYTFTVERQNIDAIPPTSEEG